MGLMPSILSRKQDVDGNTQGVVGSGDRPAIEETANNVEHDYPDSLYDINKVYTSFPLTICAH